MFAELDGTIDFFVSDQDVASIVQPNPPAAKERLKIAKRELAIHRRTKCPCAEIQPSNYSDQHGQSCEDDRERGGHPLVRLTRTLPGRGERMRAGGPVERGVSRHFRHTQ